MISDHVIYLGFGDGILSGIDIRMLNGMSLVDNSSIPGVGSIGSLRYSEICQSLIVLGNKGTAFFVNDENTLKPMYFYTTHNHL